MSREFKGPSPNSLLVGKDYSSHNTNPAFSPVTQTINPISRPSPISSELITTFAIHDSPLTLQVIGQSVEASAAAKPNCPNFVYYSTKE
jgi:hypothetical protein